MPRRKQPGWTSGRESRQDADDRLTTSLAGLAMALALVVLCLFLTDRLCHEVQLENCLFSGRTNCALLIR